MDSDLQIVEKVYARDLIFYLVVCERERGSSDVEEDGWLVGVLHLLDTEDWAVDLVVNEWQVGGGWSLSDSSELVVHGSVTEADPTLVGSQVWHWDATQVSANGRAAQDGGVSSFGDRGRGFLVEQSGGWQGVGVVDLRLGETSDEDKLSIPRGLEHLTWWELRDVKLLVGVTHVSASGDHLVVDDGDDGLDGEAVVSEDESLHHVHLRTSNFVVTVLLIPDSKIQDKVNLLLNR